MLRGPPPPSAYTSSPASPASKIWMFSSSQDWIVGGLVVNTCEIGINVLIDSDQNLQLWSLPILPQPCWVEADHLRWSNFTWFYWASRLAFSLPFSRWGKWKGGGKKRQMESMDYSPIMLNLGSWLIFNTMVWL